MLRVVSIGLIFGLVALGIFAFMAKVGLKDYNIEETVKAEETKPRKTKTDDDNIYKVATSSVIREDREAPAVMDAYIEFNSKDEAVLRSGFNGFSTYNPNGYYETYQARDDEIQVIYQDSSKNEKYRIIKGIEENPGADYDIYDEYKEISVDDITVYAGQTDEGIRFIKWSRGGNNYAVVFWEGKSESEITDYVKNIG